MTKNQTPLNIQLNNDEFTLVPGGALYWQKHKILMLADTHLGKVHYFNEYKIPLPEIAFEEQLRRIDMAIDSTGAKEILVLGDMFHHEKALTQRFMESFEHWRGTFRGDVRCIVGNHDRYLTDLPIKNFVEFVPEFEKRDSFLLTHDFVESEKDIFQIYGHRHPRYLLQDHGGIINLPCFWKKESSFILPAFSSICSGTSINSELKSNHEVYLVIEDEAILAVN